jgi:hypothetical protein
VSEDRVDLAAREHVVEDDYASGAARAAVRDYPWWSPTFLYGPVFLIVGIASQVINGQGYLLIALAVLGGVGLPAALYLRLRHAIARHLPTGSRIRTGFGEARFALETPLSSSTTSYAAYRSARRHGAYVVLRARTGGRVVLPGDLISRADLARFTQR